MVPRDTTDIGHSATRVALYTRVSTDMQANKEEGSLETPEARLRAEMQALGISFTQLSDVAGHA